MSLEQDVGVLQGQIKALTDQVEKLFDLIAESQKKQEKL